MSSNADDLLEQISRRLRSRREEQGLTVRALAVTSGVSSSMISDVERGMKSPTISTLAALSQALALPLAVLVGDPARTRMRVVKASEREVLVEAGTGCQRDRFAPTVAGSEVAVLRYVVPPHTSAGPFPPHAPGTIEHLYVVSGAIRVTLGPDVAELEAGDCCSCLVDEQHGFDNRDGTAPAELIIVTEPPRAPERPTRHGRSG